MCSHETPSSQPATNRSRSNWYPHWKCGTPLAGRLRATFPMRAALSLSRLTGLYSAPHGGSPWLSALLMATSYLQEYSWLQAPLPTLPVCEHVLQLCLTSSSSTSTCPSGMGTGPPPGDSPGALSAGALYRRRDRYDQAHHSRAPCHHRHDEYD